MDLNVVAITGRLADDPAKYATDNGDVTVLRIAINRLRRRRQEGANADFIDVVAFGDQAKHAAYLAKGRQVAIQAHLQQREWTGEDGKKHSRTQVVADHIGFMGSRNNGDQNGAAATQPVEGESPTEQPAPAGPEPEATPAQPAESQPETATEPETAAEPEAEAGSAQPAAEATTQPGRKAETTTQRRRRARSGESAAATRKGGTRR